MDSYFPYLSSSKLIMSESLFTYYFSLWIVILLFVFFFTKSGLNVMSYYV